MSQIIGTSREHLFHNPSIFHYQHLCKKWGGPARQSLFSQALVSGAKASQTGGALEQGPSKTTTTTKTEKNEQKKVAGGNQKRKPPFYVSVLNFGNILILKMRNLVGTKMTKSLVSREDQVQRTVFPQLKSFPSRNCEFFWGGGYKKG